MALLIPPTRQAESTPDQPFLICATTLHTSSHTDATGRLVPIPFSPMRQTESSRAMATQLSATNHGRALPFDVQGDGANRFASARHADSRQCVTYPCDCPNVSESNRCDMPTLARTVQSNATCRPSPEPYSPMRHVGRTRDWPMRLTEPRLAHATSRAESAPANPPLCDRSSRVNSTQYDGPSPFRIQPMRHADPTQSYATCRPARPLFAPGQLHAGGPSPFLALLTVATATYRAISILTDSTERNHANTY
jgi:hypothetical protein